MRNVARESGWMRIGCSKLCLVFLCIVLSVRNMVRIVLRKSVANIDSLSRIALVTIVVLMFWSSLLFLIDLYVC